MRCCRVLVLSLLLPLSPLLLLSLLPLSLLVQQSLLPLLLLVAAAVAAAAQACLCFLRTPPSIAHTVSCLSYIRVHTKPRMVLWPILAPLCAPLSTMMLFPHVTSPTTPFPLLLPLPRCLQSLVAAIPALFSVALMAMFVFLVFGVVGIQLWSGVMKGECDKPGSGIPCALDCSGPLCQSTYGDACPAGYV